MGDVRFKDGQVLFDGGAVAMSDDCCCCETEACSECPDDCMPETWDVTYTNTLGAPFGGTGTGTLDIISECCWGGVFTGGEFTGKYVLLTYNSGSWHAAVGPHSSPLSCSTEMNCDGVFFNCTKNFTCASGGTITQTSLNAPIYAQTWVFS